MHNINNSRRGRLLPRLALIGGVLALGACDTSSLLEVTDPDIITPGSLTGDIGLNAFYAGAIGDFAVAYGGGAGGGSFRDGVATTSAYFSDEAYVAGTFPTRQEFDQRTVAENNGTLQSIFERMSRARRATEVTAELLNEAGQTERSAELLGLASVMYSGFGMLFCSGVPFSTAPLGGELEFGGPLTTPEIFERAADRARSAQSTAGTDEIRNLAAVALGRALLNLGRYQEAAQAVAGVPTDFLYVTTHSVASSRTENGFAAANHQTHRLGVSDDEGGTGVPYGPALGEISDDGNGLQFVSSDDPRVPTTFFEGAFDATVEFTIELDAWPQYGIDIARVAPFPVAGGIEARLIEAEAAMQGGDNPGALAILNDLRAGSGLGLAALDAPAGAAGMRDVLFRERAFWLYGQGLRMGDQRRLIRQYGLTEDQVFPTGAFFKGGSYGDDVNLPVPQTEVNNPEFTQCLDRNA